MLQRRLKTSTLAAKREHLQSLKRMRGSLVSVWLNLLGRQFLSKASGHQQWQSIAIQLMKQTRGVVAAESPHGSSRRLKQALIWLICRSDHVMG